MQDTLDEQETLEFIKEILIKLDNIKKSKYYIFDEHKDTLSLCEGIDIIDLPNRKAIKYNPEHQNLVNTSEDDNPRRYIIDKLKNVEVWSIFQRKHEPEIYLEDGNPLLYAFKQEKNWEFYDEYSKREIINQIVKILTKFKNAYQGETTIILPSTHGLNSFIAKIYRKINPKTIIIDDVIAKMTTQQVLDGCLALGSLFRKKYYKNEEYKDIYREKLRILSGYLEKMDKTNGGYFTYHGIKDISMRKCIETTMFLSDEAFSKYGFQINDKHVLIIDDSITFGKSIQESIKLIKSTFLPKSISVLTLFSPKQY